MDREQTRTIGKVVGGCGCALLLLIALWLAFLVYVGVQGRGGDEEASIIMGLVTCVVSMPVVLLTGVGAYFALRKDQPWS